MNQSEIEDLALQLAKEHMRNFNYITIVEDREIGEDDAESVYDLIINAEVLI